MKAIAVLLFCLASASLRGENLISYGDKINWLPIVLTHILAEHNFPDAIIAMGRNHGP